ncbi:ras and EF-hand domain-containing protein-like isoform X1 [Acipenser ruthenus]|uniref:ras and EF-hand domain-containing protein-like isoform X1 n=1 Tax=Acipenser ruthenus TaxID=7906 RepID=UPI0027415CDB|nr:ras and EF-hand domain-containing protein-like isoform X1 [Acipenser ruthenus]
MESQAPNPKPDLRRLFSACDLNKSGRIEYEDFATVCRELSVQTSQVALLFNKFDMDRDGCIDYSDFSSRFHEVSETLDLASFDGASHSHRIAWEEFEERLGDKVHYLNSSRDQLAELYQQIHAFSEDAVLQYESLIEGLIRDSRVHCLETDKLESTLRRTEEMTARQLAELEEDIQQQLSNLEKRVREEEHQKLEAAIAGLQRRHENEVSDLQATADRLKAQEEHLLHLIAKEDVSKLKDTISELTQEKDHLRKCLEKAKTSVSLLQVELDQLKNDFTDQKLQHEREKEALTKMAEERQSYSNQIEILQSVNKTLYDSNDGLRSALSTNVGSGKKRHLSPRGRIPITRVKPNEQNGQHVISYSSFAGEDNSMALDTYGPTPAKYSQVASWADNYLDSGVSDSHDAIDGQDSSNEYDSDHSNYSEGTVHYSYSCVPSDIEMSELKSERTFDMESSLAPSRRSSVGSSIRRRLPAFSPKLADTGTEDSQELGPMYRLVLAGDAGAGKSSFLLRLCMNEFRGNIPTTLGVDFQMKKLLVDGERTTLQIWDTAGQERFRSIAKSYFRKAHGVLLLYDITSERSFLNIREWIDEIRDSTDNPIPLILIGNKCDLRAEMPESSCVNTAHGEKLAMTYNSLFCETSAKDGTNVVEAVLHLAREVRKTVNVKQTAEPVMKLSVQDGKKALTNCCGM